MKISDDLRTIASRAQEWACQMALAQVFPHALFIAAYETDRATVSQLLKEAGIDQNVYCRRVVDEVRQLPRMRDGAASVSWHVESRRLLEAADSDANPVASLIAALLQADGIAVSGQTDDTGDPFAELNSLVGLDSVKGEVRKLVEMVKFNAARKAKGLEAEALANHFVFTGNPGTGKTTVARLLARIFQRLGVLRRGHLVEVDRSKLVAGYVGQSAIQTNAVIDSALDGVLFIDEAYSLVSGGTSDYGGEVIATLLKRMEDARERMIVIVAGYTREMERFVRSNPGLKSRFTKFIEFPDYSHDELVTIFQRIASTQQYELSDSAVGRLCERISQAAVSGELTGNARFVRNLFQRTKERMASRVMRHANATKHQLQRIEAEDIS